MSEMYMNENDLKDLDARENVTLTKSHKARSCPVCDEPIQDDKFASFDLGGGLQVKLHRNCMQEILDAMEPVSEKVPVHTSKSVTRKSTYVPYDQDRLASTIKQTMYEALLGYSMQ